MTDLSMLPWSEIQQEIERRFPLWALVFYHNIDGHPGKVGKRYVWAGNCDQNALIGELETLKLMLATKIIAASSQIPPGRSLDLPPDDRPARGEPPPNRTY